MAEQSSNENRVSLGVIPRDKGSRLSVEYFKTLLDTYGAQCKPGDVTVGDRTFTFNKAAVKSALAAARGACENSANGLVPISSLDAVPDEEALRKNPNLILPLAQEILPHN